MKINITMQIDEQIVTEDIIELDEYKLEELNEEELREAIEINIRQWADKKINISWEVSEE